MADDIVTLGIAVDTRDLKKAEKDLDSLANTSRTVESNVNRMASAFSNTLKGAVAGIGFGVVAKDILDTNRQMEMLRTSLTSVTGSIDAGKDAFKFIQEFATSTPFEIKDITQSFITLKNYGLEPNVKVMQAITDQASKLGASTETLQRITINLGQAWSLNKLQGEEIRSLIEAGIPVWEMLAKVTGKSTAELQKMSEKGEITRDIIGKLIEKMGEMSSGSSARAMETLSGQISNLSDAWHQFEDTLLNDKGEGYIKSFVASVTREISVLTRYLSDDVNNQIKVLEDRIKNYQGAGTVMRAFGDYTGYDVNVDKNQLARLKQQQATEEAARKERETETNRTNELKRQADEQARIEAERTKEKEKALKEQIKLSKQLAESWKDFDKEMSMSVFDSTQSLVSDVEQYRTKLAKDTEATTEKLADAWAAYNDRVLEEEKKKSDKMSKFAERAAENMQDSFATFLFDPFAKGTDNMALNFANMLRKMAAEEVTSSIFDWLKPMMKGFGSSLFSGAMGIFGYATGGDHAGGLRIVGENGPELEATGASRIFNAQQTKDILGSSGATNNIVVNVTNDKNMSADALGAKIAEQIATQVARKEIANATRAGNQLNPTTRFV